LNKSHKSFSVEECKIQASILLKSLRAIDCEKAAKRFQRLPEFANLNSADVRQQDVKRKHALRVIALEKGFQSWEQLKYQVPFIRGGFLNKWFASYSQAKTSLQAEGGFLLPFKNQFFICDANYIAQLHLDPKDPDWQLIDWDWANPNDKEAGRRLYKKWVQILEGRKP
jgi:hypothetical protein